MVDLREFSRKGFSQFGQDGVLEKIFETIIPSNKFFVEFGSSGTDDGEGNTANLRRLGWAGLLIDAENRNGSQYPVVPAKINAENIEILLGENGVPDRFGFLSIDIDGIDFYVWKAIQSFRPDVVCAEINWHIRKHDDFIVPYNPDFFWNGGLIYGCGCLPMFKLGRAKGYSLVAMERCDMIFVADEHSPETLFKDTNDLDALYPSEKMSMMPMDLNPEDWVGFDLAIKI